MRSKMFDWTISHSTSKNELFGSYYPWADLQCNWILLISVFIGKNLQPCTQSLSSISTLADKKSINYNPCMGKYQEKYLECFQDRYVYHCILIHCDTMGVYGSNNVSIMNYCPGAHFTYISCITIKIQSKFCFVQIPFLVMIPLQVLAYDMAA